MTCKRCHRRAKYRGLCAVHFEAIGYHGFVDSQPTRDRIALLRSRGYSLRALADRTGITVPTLLCKYNKVQAATQAAVFGVPIPAMGGGGHVPVLGSARRIRALVAIGWTQRAIALRLGVDYQHVSRIVRCECVKVTGHMAARVIAVYDALWDKPGPSDTSRARAAREGWASPMMWDDNDIDDPDGRPYGKRKRGRKASTDGDAVSFVDRYLDAAEVASGDEAIAAHMGITVDSLKRQYARHRGQLEWAS